MIIENLLPEEQYKDLKDKILSDYFAWYWNDYINNASEIINGFQLVHIFYKDNKINSSAFDWLNCIMQNFEEKTNLKIKTINRIKANLNTKNSLQDINVKDLFHKDDYDDKYISLLYYVNDSDGDTIFENHTVSPKGNKLIMFKSNQLHAGSSPKIHNRRIVINFMVELIS